MDWERDDEKHTTTLVFHYNDVIARVDVCDDHGGKLSVIDWSQSYSFDAGSSAKMPFTAEFVRTVAPHHDAHARYNKATSYPKNWDELREILVAGLTMAANGEAFLQRGESWNTL